MWAIQTQFSWLHDKRLYCRFEDATKVFNVNYPGDWLSPGHLATIQVTMSSFVLLVSHAFVSPFSHQFYCLHRSFNTLPRLKSAHFRFITCFSVLTLHPSSLTKSRFSHAFSNSQDCKIVLVGGMMCLPKAVEIIKTILGCKPSKGVKPDEAVAIGASIQSGVLAGNVTPLSLVLMQ